MQSDPLKPRDFIALPLVALRFSALVGRRGGVAACNARAATATQLIRYLVPGSPDAGSGVFPRLFGSLLLSAVMALSAAAQNAPGVTDHEIKIGQTMPYSGPGARFSVSGLAEKAYMQMINDQGGINGRRINLSTTASRRGAPGTRPAS
jgi:ABC-type branched-subunit amino acid transport system substrate-binding protein